MTNCGFIALLGRPNVGKSTLINRVVGAKVAIVSDKPQTTRRAIRGLLSAEESQLIMVDLPGVQRPLDELTGRMQARVEREIAECDGALLVLNGKEGVGPGDRFTAAAIAAAGVPATVAVSKTDLLDRPRTVLALQAAADLTIECDLDAEIFPISAKTGDGVDALVSHLYKGLPEGPFMFDPEDVSDLPLRVVIAELIREEVLVRTRQEVPHAVEVEVSEMEEMERGLLVIRAVVLTETESQKRIVVGKNGSVIKAIGMGARGQIEDELERKVHLDLTVHVREHWRRSGEFLDRLGID